MALPSGANSSTALDPALRLSLALGLILTFVLTVVVASTMSPMPGHRIGTPLTGAALPVMGWSGEVGDLRVAHFLSTHAMHFIPFHGIIALALTSVTTKSALVWTGAAGFTLLVSFTFMQALQGMPLIAI